MHIKVGGGGMEGAVKAYSRNTCAAVVIQARDFSMYRKQNLFPG